MFRAVIHLTIVNTMRSHANLQKVRAATWPLASRNFLLESEHRYTLSLPLFTFRPASGHVASLISMSIYIVYYYISYTIRNIIKLIKRRDRNKKRKGKKTRFCLAFCLAFCIGHFRKSQQFLGRQTRKSSLLFNIEHKTL